MDELSSTAPLRQLARTSTRALVVMAVVGGIFAGVHLVGAAPGGVEAAQQQLRQATAERVAADETVAERQERVSELEAQLGQLDEADLALTEDLAAARRELREYAVAAYIDGGQAEVFRSSLSPEQAMALAWQSSLAVGQSGTADDAARRFAELKEANSPARLDSAAALDVAERELEEARFDAIQAAAFERDAESALARARAADAAAAAAAARERAAAASSAASSSSGSSSRAASTGSASAAGDAATEVAEAPAPAPAPAPPSGAMGNPTAEESETLARIRHCESRGNYSIVSASGRYRGAYQFDYVTWQGMGGTGDPAAASPAEQDYRALLLLRARGTRPWPHCGR